MLIIMVWELSTVILIPTCVPPRLLYSGHSYLLSLHLAKLISIFRLLHLLFPLPMFYVATALASPMPFKGLAQYKPISKKSANDSHYYSHS